jgi:hypothetical protein
MPRKRRNNKNKKPYGGPRNPMGRSPESPPPYHANLYGSKRFRFIGPTGGSGALSITPAKLGSLVVMGITTTTVAGLFDQVRVKYVEMWSPTISTGQPNSVAVTFLGSAAGIQGGNQTFSDTSVGMTYNAHIKAIPHINSQAGQWQNANVNNTGAQQTLFVLQCSAGFEVIDVMLEYRFTNDARAGAASTTTVSTSTAGQLFYLALDNAAGSSGSSGNTLTPDPALVTTV